MNENSRQVIEIACRLAPPEDPEAFSAANRLEFIHVQTGMTRARFKKVFGVDPNTMCKLHVFAGRQVPQSPEEWEELAKRVKECRAKLNI